MSLNYMYLWKVILKLNLNGSALVTKTKQLTPILIEAVSFTSPPPRKSS